ncbi:transporter substrate-binding domain-containing protein [Legionella londiniensis]|uniref:Arginine-binding periplasmic protein n=1 Tax=Legionella londiniensis TaxID=45068 RepID=A0A0W0VSQ5_9GAMM|nr:transporter substrate-binding domain-containing protein [Legionella londiniensis]KTD23268.1 arginine-binding periplasmic protein [Legionella londiniensis]STX93720.1 arginine-binding periplasmic protein [Legionella londiniensis]
MQNKIIVVLLLFITCKLHAATLNNTLKVGTLIYNPPYEISLLNKHYSYGFNIEIMQRLCKLIQYQCTMVPMRFDELLTALNENKVDAIIVGISLEPIHMGRYAFSNPYFIGNAVFLTRSASQFSSLDHKTVGVVKNTLVPMKYFFDLIFIDDAYQKQEDVIHFKFFKNLPDLLDGLNREQVDAIFLDAGAAQYWVDESAGAYRVTGPIVSLHHGMMVMSLKKNQRLIDLINSTLVEMENNGELLAIYRKYWGAIYPYAKATGVLLPLGGRSYQFMTPFIKR